MFPSYFSMPFQSPAKSGIKSGGDLRETNVYIDPRLLRGVAAIKNVHLQFSWIYNISLYYTFKES
jgi:hypothetical protein